MKKYSLVVGLVIIPVVIGCAPRSLSDGTRLIPAQEFTRKARTGHISDFSIYQAADTLHAHGGVVTPVANQAEIVPVVAAVRSPTEKALTTEQQEGDPRYLSQGYQLRRSVAPALPVQIRDWQKEPQADSQPAALMSSSVPLHSAPELPVGSRAPYADGQMTANPSLWPDEGQGATLFRDFRAFQPMDVVTILVNEQTEGRKKTETDAKSEFSLTASIAHLFGIETKNWANSNEALDPENLIAAESNIDMKGEGETKREGRLRGRLSAVILELLPNGILRIEGTKIVSVDNEEETMVLSGLVRQRDIDADNQVDSSRIANMRIDFYGRGILGDQTDYGWGAKLFKWIWPF